MSSQTRWLARYALALAAVGAALLLFQGLTRRVGPGLPTYVTFYPAVMLVALFGGLGPGLLATTAAALAADYWIIPPIGSLVIGRAADGVGLGLFSCMGAFMSTVAELYRRARQKAAAYDKEASLRESQDALRQQREWLQVTLNSIGDAVLATDTAGCITFLNPVAATLTGWPPEQARRQPAASVFRTINEETRAPGDDITARVLREGRVVTLANHTALITRDGQETPIEDSAAPILDRAGNVSGVVLVFHDVTEKRRAQETLARLNASLERRVAEQTAEIRQANENLEQRVAERTADLQIANEALRASRRAAFNLRDDALAARKQAEEVSAELRRVSEQRRLALEAADLGAWDYRFNTGEVFWDERCRDMWGIAQGDRMDYAKTIAGIHPDDRQSVDEAVRNALAGADAGRYHREFRVLWGDGSAHWIASHGRVYFEGEGEQRRAARFIGANREITEEKHAQMALRESEERLRLAQMSARVGVWDLRLPTAQLNFTAELERVYGLAPGAIKTYQDWRRQVHPEDIARVEAERESAIANRRTFDMEFRVVHATGEIRWISSLGGAHYDAAGKPVRVLGVNLDITERKRADELLQSQAKLLEKLVQERTAKLQDTINELEHFSYAIVHDMRAPLRALQGFAGLLEEDCAGCPRTRNLDYFRRIQAAAKRMDQLITDSLSYSKTVREELPLRPVELAELLESLLETYPNLQPDKADIQIEGPLPSVLGNEAALTQCFSNLLGNAVKFVPPGAKPQVRVRAEPRGNRVRVWVADNGIGIPEGFQQRLFTMFQRATGQYEGTGIGLAIVRKVVHRMGGEVGVESELGQGSRFWVELKTAKDAGVDGSGHGPQGHWPSQNGGRDAGAM